MSRVKTFDATGLATSGRVYAGDLNSIQDQYADLTNLSQLVSVGSLAVGEAGLQLIRYGPGEARISGALRADGIVRALGGLYAGAFSTPARDAIGAGLAPTGLVILNLTTSRYEFNYGTDGARQWRGMDSAIASGALGARSAASTVNANTFYFATDDNGGTLYFSNGSAWTKAARGLTETVSAAQITNDTITAAQIAANAIGSSELADASVDTTAIIDGSITTPKIGSAVPLVPVGSVLDWPWASGSIPAWALLPYGQLLTQAAYPAMQALADASARPYGGSAGTNFNMPDMRGRSGVGMDNMGGTAANRITAAISGINGTILGAAGGAEGVTLTTAQLPAHNHVISPHSHTVNSHGHSISGTPNINNGTLGVSGGGSHNHFSPYAENFLGIAGNGGATGNALYAGAMDRGYEVYGTDNKTQGAGAAPTLTGTVTGDRGSLVADGNTAGTDAQSPAIGNSGADTIHQNVPPTIIVNKIMRVA